MAKKWEIPNGYPVEWMCGKALIWSKRTIKKCGLDVLQMVWKLFNWDLRSFYGLETAGVRREARGLSVFWKECS
jgi:hypothetical protein